VDEPARKVLAEQRAIGGRGTWDQDPSLFVHLLLQRSIENYSMARELGEIVVFDRGIPDCAAYAVRAGEDPGPSLRAAEEFRYQPEVLLLEPWLDIYETDEERILSFDETIGFHRQIVEAYERAGYTLTVVPQDTIEERAAFVQNFIDRRTSAPNS
jgi:predicted ATPase